MAIDIIQESALCDTGTHFFCAGCLSAVPVARQSRNKKYCDTCYASIQADAEAVVSRKAKKQVADPDAENTPADDARNAAKGTTKPKKADKKKNMRKSAPHAKKRLTAPKKRVSNTGRKIKRLALL
jgi:DNA-directed RNA polymerase subunit M/transcription elongation factor TFIIS